MSAWLFQGNPKFYKVRPALRHFSISARATTWLVNKHRSRVHTGDLVFFWEAGPEAGLVGWGTTETEPCQLPMEAEESQFVVERARFDGARLRVRIKVESVCHITRNELRQNPILTKWAPVARGVQGTNFEIPADVRGELEKTISKRRPNAS
jgi:hypothetical protein